MLSSSASTGADLARADRAAARLPLRAVVASTGLASLVLAGVFLVAMLASTGGRLVAPLDDAYIYFQYARNLADGRFFSYGPGEPYSTGSTSFLYPWLLAAGYRVGLDGSLMVLWGLGLAAVTLWASAVLLYVVAARWLGAGAAALAAALFLLSGPVLWAVLGMMETGLYIALLLGALLAWDAGRHGGRFWAFGVVGAFLALTRPEGAALAVLLGLLALIDRGLSAGRAGLRDRALLPLGLPLVAAGGYMGLNLALTGTTATNGLTSKSILYDPDLMAADRVRYMAEAFASFFQVPFGSPEYVPPFMVLLAAVGGAALAYGEAAERRAGLGTAASVLFLAGLLTVTHNGNYAMHWYRYLAPYLPLFILLAVGGLVWIGRVAGAGEGAVLRAGGAYLLLFTAVTGAVFLGRYGASAADIDQQHMEAARWLRDRVPEGQTVALNDAGALPYMSGRPVYDLLGLVTNGAAEPARHGPGSSVERLERLPPGERPAYLAVYDGWFYHMFGGLPMMEEIQRFHLERRAIAGDDDLVVYRVDRSAYGSGASMASGDEHAGWTVVDAVDVADVEDEAAHGYTVWDTARDLRPTVVRQLRPDGGDDLMLDGGRETAGGERFTAAVSPGRALRLVMRAAAPVPATVDVFVNGEHAGYLQYDKGQTWAEPYLDIPADLVTKAESEIEVRFSRGDYSDRYTSFHYWLLQREAGSRPG